MVEPRRTRLLTSSVASRSVMARVGLPGVGVALLLAVAIAVLVEGWLLGWSSNAAFGRVQVEVRAQFDRMADSLRAAAESVAQEVQLIRDTIDTPTSDRQLFDVVESAIDMVGVPDLAVTVYGSRGATLAWSGRPSELPRERISAAPMLSVVPGPLGLRIVHVEPVVQPGPGREASALERVATVAAERVLSSAEGVRGPPDGMYRLSTSRVTVLLHAPGDTDATKEDTFVIRDPDGRPLLEVEVPAAELSAARARLRRTLLGILLGLVACVALLLIGSTLDARAGAGTARQYVRTTIGTAALLVWARLTLWFAIPAASADSATLTGSLCAPGGGLGPPRTPIDLLLSALTVLGLVALAGDGVSRYRLAARRRRRDPEGQPLRFAVPQVGAGALMVTLLLGHQRLLRTAIDCTAIDVLNLSFQPWDPEQLAFALGLIVWHTALVWTCVLVLLLAMAPWRITRALSRPGLLLVAAWTSPAILLAGLATARGWQMPPFAVLLVVVTAVVGAYLARRVVPWYRHASQAARLLAGFVTLLLPAITLYPSVAFHADRAKRRLIEERYAVQSMRHPQELQERLSQVRRQVDTVPELIQFATAPEVGARRPEANRAFLIWQQTDLAERRLTSGVELYGPDGGLVSRFAFNLPEYTTTSSRWQGRSCLWEVSGEVSRFGAVERRLLHAERGLCTDTGDVAGAIVVHVMLDYSALPFLSPQRRYFELLRSSPRDRTATSPAGDVELVIYGWGRFPTYSSGVGAWPLDDDLFSRIYGDAARQPFWTRLSRGGGAYDVYILNDRAGIYALGYPEREPFDIFVHLAEVAGLAGVLYVVLWIGATLFSSLVRSHPRSGRHLLREIRGSYYRKLFLAFVAASVVPVLILAYVIRTYFTTILATDVEAEAARAAAVAQRVIEEVVALQEQGPASLASVSDDVLVWIGQVIDQDVNIFDGSQLVATSDRDLFASGLLPTRTPHAVYRAIQLQRLPSFVGRDVVGDQQYLVAATPVRLGSREAILTVPLTLRQQEIDKETQELDRGVYLAAVVFVLLGGGIGFSMAERIGDPVQRLTRATRRIARGDLDARVVVRSADELQRLVEAFNSMARDLRLQRDQLERTHRLEAWAEMARQVAHEIKNPLTPIQLSAEHLRRVHEDRGEPLSPVLESCVESILRQVRLLRQIASEFSSFASSPTARPEPTAVGALVEEIVHSYRTGLGDRIALSVGVAPDLPLVLVDRTLLGRALTNVIENALHAMPGSGSLTITVRCLHETIQIVTTDTGVGMEPEALARIFEPYFSTKATGTGLGLTIAKRNVELNGGTITVESEKDLGTTVTLGLPIAGGRAGPE